jgi:hypothetical protein
MKASRTTALLLTSATAVSGFVVHQNNNNGNVAGSKKMTQLNGLFDGVKEAFSAPPSQLDAERETPIDRWMGWSVVSENTSVDAAAVAPTGTTTRIFYAKDMIFLSWYHSVYYVPFSTIP